MNTNYTDYHLKRGKKNIIAGWVMGEKQRDQNLIWSKLIQFNLITKFSGMRKYLLDFKAYATVLMVNIQEKKRLMQHTQLIELLTA